MKRKTSMVVQLHQSNIDAVSVSNELVFIFFYTEWCRFCNTLMPIFDEAADKIEEEFPERGRVVLGKVDCDKETEVAKRFRIEYYPTFKVIRNGHPDKRKYEGQRSAEAFVTFIKKQLEDPIKEFSHLKELTSIDTDKRLIIGYFDRRDQPEYNIFRRVASNLKDDCIFYVGFGDASISMHPPGQPVIVFRPDKKRSVDTDETYTGNMNIFNELHIWAQEKCVPLVREMTSENATHLYGEELPFLILLHKPGDDESIKKYNEVVQKELLSEKKNINFFTADCRKFALPLYHLCKSESDLPLIAIDSLHHMHLFPKFEHMTVPDKLKGFIRDLHSGKLHREYHYGPSNG